MKVAGPYPFTGEVIWLTADQGGRVSGPPPDPDNYAHVAHVPPFTIETGSASCVLRAFDPARLRSPAEGKWLAVENDGPQRVEVGSIVVITEGAKVSAFFRVASIDA
jgi:hypothetical protein